MGLGDWDNERLVTEFGNLLERIARLRTEIKRLNSHVLLSLDGPHGARQTEQRLYMSGYKIAADDMSKKIREAEQRSKKQQE